jgi:hypothetical protein
MVGVGLDYDGNFAAAAVESDVSVMMRRMDYCYHTCIRIRSVVV